MGVSISLHIYSVGDIIRQIDKFIEENGGKREGALPSPQFFMKIADEFGVISDGKFYSVWNEYYENYNSASELLRAVGRYYFPNEELDDGLWLPNYESKEGANADEVLEELFEDEFGYEGKFSGYDE